MADTMRGDARSRNTKHEDIDSLTEAQAAVRIGGRLLSSGRGPRHSS